MKDYQPLKWRLSNCTRVKQKLFESRKKKNTQFDYFLNQKDLDKYIQGVPGVKTCFSSHI